MNVDQYLTYIFVLVLLVNIVSMLMFLGRVWWPKQRFQPAGIFGVIAILLGFPASILVGVGVVQDFGISYWLMPLLYVAFTLFALIVDVILKVEFRQPRRLEILIPFLLIYFLPVLGMWGMVWNLGLVYWLLTGVTYSGMIGSAIYASRKGVG